METNIIQIFDIETNSWRDILIEELKENDLIRIFKDQKRYIVMSQLKNLDNIGDLSPLFECEWRVCKLIDNINEGGNMTVFPVRMIPESAVHAGGILDIDPWEKYNPPEDVQ